MKDAKDSKLYDQLQCKAVSPSSLLFYWWEAIETIIKEEKLINMIKAIYSEVGKTLQNCLEESHYCIYVRGYTMLSKELPVNTGLP